MVQTLFVLGGVMVVAGLVLHYWPQSLAWFGHLPGDLRVETDQVFILLPFTSMAIVSAVLTLLIQVLRG